MSHFSKWSSNPSTFRPLEMQLKPLTVAVLAKIIFRGAYCLRRLKIAASSDIYTMWKTNSII